MLYRNDQAIEYDSHGIKHSSITSQEEMRSLEMIGGAKEAKQGNESIRCNCWYSTRRDQRGECNLAWQDCAEDDSTENVDYGHGMLGLTSRIDLTYPTRQGQNPITGDSKNQTRGSNDGHARVLGKEWSKRGAGFKQGTYQNQPDDGNDSHDDAALFAQSHCVNLYEGLGCFNGEKRIKVWSAEKK